MKKILISLSVIVALGAVVAGATGAFFSDTETSRGNTFTAGAIDLGIDNASYLNGVFNEGTSWDIDFDLDDGAGRFFYNFLDIKPGDYGEDTISIHVNNNDAWICAETTVQTDDDVDCTEPELDDDPTCLEPNNDTTDGDLANEIEIMWWADDGDNVLEDDEQVLDQGRLGQAPLGFPITSVLADSNWNIWTNQSNDPAPGATDLYVAKAWCFGDLGRQPLPFGAYPEGPAGDNNGNQTAGEPEDGGFTCTGASVVSNASQSDRITLDVSFSAVQSRNNESFVCGND